MRSKKVLIQYSFVERCETLEFNRALNSLEKLGKVRSTSSGYNRPIQPIRTVWVLFYVDEGQRGRDTIRELMAYCPNGRYAFYDGAFIAPENPDHVSQAVEQ